jgi:hypothetical protein
MKNPRNDAPVLPRGRVANWTKEQLDKLSTADLQALRSNAEGLKETEVAALCTEILATRPGAKARARKHA